jgi:hypothetical protein
LFAYQFQKSEQGENTDWLRGYVAAGDRAGLPTSSYIYPLLAARAPLQEGDLGLDSYDGVVIWINMMCRRVRRKRYQQGRTHSRSEVRSTVPLAQALSHATQYPDENGDDHNNNNDDSDESGDTRGADMVHYRVSTDRGGAKRQ